MQGFNACIGEILPAVDFSMAGESKSIASLLCKLRGGLFPSMKTNILTSALRHTDSGVRPTVTATFNIPSARLAQEQATVGGQRTGVTLFQQGFEALNKIDSIADLRVYGETAFKCDLAGMSAQGKLFSVFLFFVDF